MGPAELILLSVAGGGTFAASITTIIHAHLGRLGRKAESQAIDPWMREEIEQSPKWWAREFHNLLQASGAAVAARVPVEPSFNHRTGEWRQHSDRVAYEGCMCIRCENVHRDLEKVKVPLHNANPEFIRELQNMLGVVADGIVGPMTLIRARQYGFEGIVAPMRRGTWALLAELIEQPMPELGVVGGRSLSSYRESKREIAAATKAYDYSFKRNAKYSGVYEDDVRREVEYWKSLKRA